MASGSVVGLVAVVAAASVLALHSLAAPLIKRRLQAAVLEAAGVDIDYRDARVDVLSGLAIDQLVVRSPLGLQAFAPDLVRVGRLRAQWSLPALLAGKPAAIERVELADVLLAVVMDEHGRTSFDALAGAGAAAPSVPISHKPERWLASAAPVARVELERVAVELTRTEHGALFDRSGISGLSASLQLPGRHAGVALGAEAKPLALSARRSTADGAAGSARAALWASAQLSASQLTAALELRVLEQSFAAPISSQRWLHVEARADFDAVAGRTRLELERADAADDALRVEAELELPDAGEPLLRRARGEIDLGRLLTWVPEGLVPVHVARAHARFDVSSLVLAAPPRVMGDGAATIDAQLTDFALSVPSGPLTLSAAQCLVHASPDANGQYKADGSLEAQRVRFGELLVADDVVIDGAAALAADGGITGRVAARLGLVSVPLPAPGNNPLNANTLTSTRGAHAALSRARLGHTVLQHGPAASSRAPALSGSGLHPDTEPQTRGEHAPASHVRSAQTAQRRGSLRVHAAHFELQAVALHPDVEHSRGELTLTGELTAVDVEGLVGPVSNAHVSGLGLHAHSLLSGGAPYAASWRIDAAQLGVADAEGKRLVDAPAHFEGQLRDLRPDLQHPAATSGEAKLTLALGDSHLTLDAQQRQDVLDFDVRADAGSLTAARQFLPQQLSAAAAQLTSRGRIEHPLAARPALRQHSELRLQHFGFQDIHADALAFTLDSHGTALRHALELDMRARGLAFRDLPASDDHLQLTAAVDREQRSAQVRITSEGRAHTSAQAALSFDPAARALRYDLDAQLSGLGPLAPLLSRLRGIGTIDPQQLEVSLSSHGTLSGVISDIASDGSLQLAESPERSALALGKNDLQLSHLVWSRGDTTVAAPDLHWRSELGGSSERRTLSSQLELASLHVERGSDQLDLNGVAQRADFVIIGNLLDPEVELTQQLELRGVEQALVPEYPLGEVTLALTAEGGRNGIVHISELSLANGAAGTALALSGNVDLSEGHRTLSVTTALTQDLARLSGIPERMQGRGKLSVEAHVTSPDFARYRVRAAVKSDDVSLKLARAGIELQHASGEVPVAVSLEFGEHGVTFERSDKRNPYSMLRFADQHPLLSRSGFVSIGKLDTPFASIAPLVGNLEIEQNVISLRQFELGVRGGHITGQCGLDLDGQSSTLELHVRANGVLSSHGEPFDGNIAVAMSAADRSIDGRAEILRIGERHLQDLLDLQDPLHVDAAMNRIRSALGWGYPKTLRLTFDHGFASAHLELGGLAKLISISDLRGIPMGPIVDKMIARMLEAGELKEMP